MPWGWSLLALGNMKHQDATHSACCGQKIFKCYTDKNHHSDQYLNFVKCMYVFHAAFPFRYLHKNIISNQSQQKKFFPSFIIHKSHSNWTHSPCSTQNKGRRMYNLKSRVISIKLECLQQGFTQTCTLKMLIKYRKDTTSPPPTAHTSDTKKRCHFSHVR